MSASRPAPPSSAAPSWLTYTLAIVACLLVGATLINKLAIQPTDIQLDSPRYAINGLNLLDHGTLNVLAYDPLQEPKPEISTSGFLTAVEIAAAAALHDGTKQTLICLANERDHARARCTGSLLSVKILYGLELIVFLVALWHIARLVLDDAAKAWLAVLLVLPCRETFLYASSVLTEPLFLCVATLFLWAWAAAWQRLNNPLLWLAAGILLGLTAHVKPIWTGLAPLLFLALAWQGWRQRTTRRQWWAGGILMLTGLVLTLGPMLVRNIIQLNLWGFSDPVYFGQSMAHRMGYNSMTGQHWLIGWAVYFPDSGDNVVKAIAGQAVITPFAWDAGSFYIYGRDVLYRALVAEVGRDQVGRYLVIHEIFGNPVKNVAVTLLLLWRGILLGRLWSLIALLAIAPVLRRILNPQQREAWLLIFLPALAVAALNAQVSVSIVRYNLALIPAFAIILAALVAWLASWAAVRFAPNRRLTGMAGR